MKLTLELEPGEWQELLMMMQRLPAGSFGNKVYVKIGLLEGIAVFDPRKTNAVNSKIKSQSFKLQVSPAAVLKSKRIIGT